MIQPISYSEYTAASITGNVLLYFWAAYAGAIPVFIEDLSTEYDGRVLFLQSSIDDNPQFLQTMYVGSIPTMLLLKDGVILDTLVGYQRRQDYATAIAIAFGL